MNNNKNHKGHEYQTKVTRQKRKWGPFDALTKNKYTDKGYNRFSQDNKKQMETSFTGIFFFLVTKYLFDMVFTMT